MKWNRTELMATNIEQYLDILENQIKLFNERLNKEISIKDFEDLNEEVKYIYSIIEHEKSHSKEDMVLTEIGVQAIAMLSFDEISFTHPEIVQTEKSGEAKKYTLHSKSGNGNQQNELTLDEEVEGTTDNFDLIEMDNQGHEYVKLPKVTVIRRNSNKQRDFKDENTKKYYIHDQGKRGTSDAEGSKVARGLENESLYDIQVQGELGEFIKVLKVLENYPEVQSINVIQGSLKEFSDTKRFVYLSDGITKRKFVIAEIKLFSGKEVMVLKLSVKIGHYRH